MSKLPHLQSPPTNPKSPEAVFKLRPGSSVLAWAMLQEHWSPHQPEVCWATDLLPSLASGGLCHDGPAWQVTGPDPPWQTDLLAWPQTCSITTRLPDTLDSGLNLVPKRQVCPTYLPQALWDRAPPQSAPDREFLAFAASWLLDIHFNCPWSHSSSFMFLSNCWEMCTCI